MLHALVLALLSLQGVSPRALYHPTPDGPRTLEEAEKASRALHGVHYGGDIILPDSYNQSGTGLRDVRFRWPGYPGGAVIPYVIDASLWRQEDREMILRAMEYYHRTTCIRFVERTNQNDFVRIYAGDGCWSRPGRIGGQQDLSLGENCVFFGLVVHELGHAVGLVHEHQRPDRDYWINVYRQNVKEGLMHNFVLEEDVVQWRQYDYNSIMHYGNYAFSKEYGTLMTMQAKNGQRLLEPFEKPGFTDGDLSNIKNLLKC